MQPFMAHGIVAPMDRATDTDLMVPKQFLNLSADLVGPNLFDELRYLDVGEPMRIIAIRSIRTSRNLTAIRVPRFCWQGKFWLWFKSRVRSLGNGRLWLSSCHCAELR